MNWAAFYMADRYSWKLHNMEGFYSKEDGTRKQSYQQGKNESSLVENKSSGATGFSLAGLWCFPLAGLVARQEGSLPSPC